MTPTTPSSTPVKAEPRENRPKSSPKEPQTDVMVERPKKRPQPEEDKYFDVPCTD
jgi:hypothetical protein